MKTMCLNQYQRVLQHLRLMLLDIDRSRFIASRTDHTQVIEDKQQIAEWMQQLKVIMQDIRAKGVALEKQIKLEVCYEGALDAFAGAIDDLIDLNKDVVESCAYDTELMEGRYLLHGLIIAHLDLVRDTVNEYRYNLNDRVLVCNEHKGAEFREAWLLVGECCQVEFKALKQWCKS